MRLMRNSLIFLCGFYCATSFAQMVVLDPANLFENVISTANSGAQLINQATQIANQATQIQNQLTNLKNYNNTTSWSDTSGVLTQLSSTVSQGNALSYNAKNMNAVFQEKFPGYKSQTDYDTEYQKWSSTNMVTLSNTLASAGMQANSFSDEQATLNTLKILSTSSEGRMQAIQVGNMIAAEQVGQMQKLRQLIISQTNAQNVYMASKVQQEQAQQASAHDLLSNPLPYPKYGTGQGFGSDNLPNLDH